jgi:hypothetical protein
MARSTDARLADRGDALFVAAKVSQPPICPLALRAIVYAPDGRRGEVIGFYRRSAVSALVRFTSGECAEFLVSELVLST